MGIPELLEASQNACLHGFYCTAEANISTAVPGFLHGPWTASHLFDKLTLLHKLLKSANGMLGGSGLPCLIFKSER